jgi:hypothetical protein
VQLKNITGKGFAMFYGDENSNQFVVYDLNGRQTVKKTIKEPGEGFSMLTSGTDVYMLIKNKNAETIEEGYNMLAYRTTDSTVLPKYVIRDKKGNSLRVIAFDNEPVTGKPLFQVISLILTHSSTTEQNKEVFYRIAIINNLFSCEGCLIIRYLSFICNKYEQGNITHQRRIIALSRAG